MKKKRSWILLMALAVFIGILGCYTGFRSVTTDTRAPEVMVAEELLCVSVFDPQSAFLQGITAMDETDGDVTESIVVESIYGITEDNRVTVTYAAFDRAGNVTKLERQVELSDYRAPVFTLSGPLAFQDGSNFDVMSLVGARDLRDGDLHHKLKATSMSSVGSITEVGIHDIQFRVTNSLGDTQHLMLPLEVYPKEKYTAQASLTDYLVYLPVGASFNPHDYVKSFSVFGENVGMQDVRFQIQHQVDMSKPGVYPVSYTGMYTKDNRSYAAYTKLIVIVEG